MKLSKLIKTLEELHTDYGDLEVIDTYDNDDFTLEVQEDNLILCEEA